MSSQIETEAKFIIPDLAVFEALQRLTILEDFRLNRVAVKQVVDQYLDTVDRRIYQAGFACRLRQGQAKQILALKSLTPAEGGIHRRQEVEAEVDSDQVQEWEESEAKRLVLKIIGDAALERLFTIYQTRYKFHVHHQQGPPIIEMSLDQVSLKDAAVTDYYELEAELMSEGGETELQAFVQALQNRWSLKVETQSKFERGLAAFTAKGEA